MKIKSRNNKSKFVELINKNIDKVREFIFANIPPENIRHTSYIYKDKITIKCPYCGDTRNKYKLVINLDWCNFKCFRCSESGSIIKLFKDLDIYQQFSELISGFYNLSNFDISTLFRSAAATSHRELIDDNTSKEINIFIKNNGLVSINKISTAKEYALKRAFFNQDEIESYLADDKYIYVPIVIFDKIAAYMARRYVEIDTIPKYIIHTFNKDVPLIGFLDEVINNMSSNDLYITEGYYDSYAINYAMTNYVSICTFGKNKVKNIKRIVKYFPENTNIYITLDSIVKDPAIINDTYKMGDELSKYFTNMYVVNLDEGDPAEILEKNGPLYLKKSLKENIIPYVKYKILFALKNKRTRERKMRVRV